MKYICEVFITLVLLFMVARLTMMSCDMLNSPSDFMVIVGMLGLMVSAILLWGIGSGWQRIIRFNRLKKTEPSLQAPQNVCCKNQQKEKTE